MKRHQRPTRQNPQGGILEKEAPIHISNVMVVCAKCNAGVKTKFVFLEDGSKVRTCKQCNEIITVQSKK